MTDEEDEAMTHFTHAVECLTQGRAARLAGSVNTASVQERKGEAALRQCFPRACACDDGCSACVDCLMTVWECSLATTPLELPEWQAAQAALEVTRG